MHHFVFQTSTVKHTREKLPGLTKVVSNIASHCNVLYYAVLNCTILYCTVLYCTVLYCTVLYCTVLYCTVLYCTVLYCTVLYCTVLTECTVPVPTVLYSQLHETQYPISNVVVYCKS